MNKWKHRISNSYFTIFLIGLVSVVFVTQFSWKGNDNKAYSRVISSDGVGYYYYLPNTFLSKKIDFHNIKIDNKEIDVELLRVIEDFNDISFSNINKSKRILNDFFKIYEG